MRLTTTARLLLAVAFCGIAGAAHAAALSVDPLKVELTPQARGAAITVRNDGPDPVVVQIKVMAWSQPEGKDQLDPTRELLVTPAVVEVPGRGQQVLRLGRRAPAPASGREQTFRVLIKEVLPEQKTPGTALRMALELSLPVFVADAAVPAGALEWQARREGDSILMVAHNTGGKRVRVTAAELADASGRALGAWRGVTYLLAGATRSFRFKAPASVAAGSALKLKLTTESGDAVVTAVLASEGR